MNGLSRTLFLFGAFVLGGLFTGMAELAFVIQYMVIYMLFLSYLSMPFKGNPVKKTHLWILLANIALGCIPYFLLKPFSHEFALLAYMCGIIPSAIAAPVIISMIHRDVAFASTSVLVTNLSMAVVIPLTLPWLVGQEIQIDVGNFVTQVMLVLIGPFVVAMALRRYLPAVAGHLKKLNRITFFIWLTAIWIAVAKSVVYLKSQETVSTEKLLITAAIVMSICILSFGIGHLIGGKRFDKEAAQSLGQKNVMFAIWISLTYLNPFIAMGPTFYIFFHHLYNGWLLFRYSDAKSETS